MHSVQQQWMCKCAPVCKCAHCALHKGVCKYAPVCANVQCASLQVCATAGAPPRSTQVSHRGLQLTLVCRCNSQSPGFSSSCRCHCSSTTVTKLPVTDNNKVAVDPPTTNESHLYVPTDMPHRYHQVITDVPLRYIQPAVSGATGVHLLVAPPGGVRH